MPKGLAPWGHAPTSEVELPGRGTAPQGKEGVSQRNGAKLTILLEAASARDAGTLGHIFPSNPFSRLNLYCASEVEFDPCRQLIWTFLAWIICLAVSTDQINWMIAKSLLSCAPLGSWCGQQDGVALQGQTRLEN